VLLAAPRDRHFGVINSGNFTAKAITFQNGRQNSTSPTSGGSFWISDSASAYFLSCLFWNNTIDSTSGQAQGGAVFILNADQVVFRNTVLRENTAISQSYVSGAAVYVYHANKISFVSSAILRNTAWVSQPNYTHLTRYVNAKV
jgi:hypothetical protein